MFYSYECESCHNVTTINCMMKDMKRNIVCPECGGKAVKLIEAPTLVGVSSSKDRINKEQVRKNVEAGKVQHGSHLSARTGMK